MVNERHAKTVQDEESILSILLSSSPSAKITLSFSSPGRNYQQRHQNAILPRTNERRSEDNRTPRSAERPFIPKCHCCRLRRRANKNCARRRRRRRCILVLQQPPLLWMMWLILRGLYLKMYAMKFMKSLRMRASANV